MTEIWDEARLMQYITDGVEESLNLDYKAAASLSRDNKKKIEITKDVSAMANSDGGIIIYGISEFQDKMRSHLPEKLDPVNRTNISKEWLEQIISNIRPKIDGLKICPVSLSSGTNDVAYVVDIPQSYTAHQATDKRYYKRFNFQSEAMQDYEIRDVMNRGQHPKIEPEFLIKLNNKEYKPFYQLHIKAVNKGNIYAKYVIAHFTLTSDIVWTVEGETIDEHGNVVPEIYSNPLDYTFNNTVQDFLPQVTSPLTYDRRGSYSPARYEPILPTLFHSWKIDLNLDFIQENHSTAWITWKIHADNAPIYLGKTYIRDIPINRD
jgi:hypothetical protein